MLVFHISLSELWLLPAKYHVYRKERDGKVSLPLLPVVPPGCEPLLLALAVRIEVVLALSPVVAVALEALKAELGRLLAGIVILTIALERELVLIDRVLRIVWIVLERRRVVALRNVVDLGSIRDGSPGRRLCWRCRVVAAVAAVVRSGGGGVAHVGSHGDAVEDCGDV